MCGLYMAIYPSFFPSPYNPLLFIILYNRREAREARGIFLFLNLAERFQFHLSSSLCVQRTGVSPSFKNGYV